MSERDDTTGDEMSQQTRHLAWWYPRGQWSGRWPSLGGDEHGYRTLVIPFPGERALVISLYRCRCEGCEGMREQTARWERDEDGWAAVAGAAPPPHGR